MSLHLPSLALRQARSPSSCSSLCTSLRRLQLSQERSLSNSSRRLETASPTTTTKVSPDLPELDTESMKPDMKTPRLSGSSIWRQVSTTTADPAEVVREDRFASRNLVTMERALNPRPDARARWQRKMLMRHIKKGGRLTREEELARTERKHLSKSVFFKGSVKKMMPLARQIAGKSIDEAILQMRFSKKRLATSVKAQLLEARNEAIVMKGMASKSRTDISKTLPGAAFENDPSISSPEPHQTPIKTLKRGETANETDLYVAEAWVNRGKYLRKREFRARGRVNIIRMPATGISILLKEEKTRTREKAEKEAKAIRRRLGKGMWTQLPDRPVINQHQHVLW